MFSGTVVVLFSQVWDLRGFTKEYHMKKVHCTLWYKTVHFCHQNFCDMEKMDFENTASSLPTQILWAFLVQKILEPFKEDFMATLLPQF